MEVDGYFSYNKVLYETRHMIINLCWNVICLMGDDEHLVDMGKIKKCLGDHVWNSIEEA